MDFHIIERLGGASRCSTLLTFAVHFLHSLFTVVNFLAWVRTPDAVLAHSMKTAYLSLAVVCCVFYFLGASVFYMWAWRFPEPEEIAKRRRIYGVAINLLFCDVPIFIVETRIVWMLRFPSAIMGFNYCLTCVSVAYSVLRVWFFFMVRVIKFRFPTATAIGANYTARSAMAARREMGGGIDYASHAVGGRGVAFAPPYAAGNAAGNTILLNGNANLYSDDATSGAYSTPTAERHHSRRHHRHHRDREREDEDTYYGPVSDDGSSSVQAPSRHGRHHRNGGGVTNTPRSAMPPYRI